MGWGTLAPKYTRIAPNQINVAIEAGAAVKVYSISMSASPFNGVVTLEEYNTTNVIATFNIPSRTSLSTNNRLLARNGLQVTTNASAEVVVYHSNAAA